MKESHYAVELAFYMILGLTFIFGITFGLYFVGVEDGEKGMVQKLCERKQYDFCEVIEQKPEYKLKELKDE